MTKPSGSIPLLLVLLAVSAANADAQPDLHAPQCDLCRKKIASQIDFNDDTAEVIICLVDETGRRPADCAILETFRQQLGDQKAFLCNCPDAITAFVDRAEARELAHSPFVIAVLPSIHLYPTLYDSVEIVRAVQAWSIEVMGTDLTGEGRTIAIVDTGVDFTHPDLQDKNIAGGQCNCTVSSACPLEVPFDVTGHGTHVAGIAAAAGDINGIGKGANIISIRVYSEEMMNMYMIYFRRALNWVLLHGDEYNISVVSISVSFR